MDEGLSFVDEGLSFVDEPLSFVDEPLSFVDRPNFCQWDHTWSVQQNRNLPYFQHWK